MSDLSVTERRIRPIQDAVAIGNWKQALRECEKWSKKGEKSDKFLALKAFVLVQQQDKGQHEKGVTETLQLCRRTPAVTDLEALDQLQDALQDLSLHQEEGPKLWDRAVAAKPADKALIMTWLKQSIVESNWLSAQKAAMALRKAFPKEREYEFWNILMCYLISQDKTLSEKERNLFGVLAYRLISKAADSVPKNNDPIPDKALSTPEELFLLCKVYNNGGHKNDLVDILSGDTLGLRSTMYAQDPQLFLELLLPVLRMSQDPQKVTPMCHNLLTMGTEASLDVWNDDRIWNLLEHMRVKTESQSLQHEVDAIFNRVEGIEETSRAALLVRLRRLSKSAESTPQHELLNACIQYHRSFGSKSFCFEVMRESLEGLDQEHLSRFQTQVGKVEDPARRLFMLKLRYAMLSKTNGPDGHIEFAMDALKMYHGEPSTSKVRPEMALLAGLALLGPEADTHRFESSIQALTILHSCSKKHEEYYPFLVVLTRICSYYGTMSFSFESFKKLSVKNMQWETVGHLMLTRIATLHPCATGQRVEDCNPFDWLESGLSMLNRADTTLVKSITEGLKYGTYSNIIDSVSMRSDTRYSLNRSLFSVEQRKIARLTNIAMDPGVPIASSELVDRRDMSFMPHYSAADSKLWDSFSCGPLPTESWVIAMRLLESIVSYLQTDKHHTPNTEDETEIVAHMKALLEPQPISNLSLTGPEKKCLECHLLLAEAILARPDNLDTIVTKMSDWILGFTTSIIEEDKASVSADAFQNTSWENLHTSFTFLETLQAVYLFASAFSEQPKVSKVKTQLLKKEQAAKLQDLAIQGQDAVHKKARAVKERLNAGGVLGRLVDIALARKEDASEQENALSEQLEKLCNEVEAETLCGKMRESWEDAWDGVLAVKIKPIK